MRLFYVLALVSLSFLVHEADSSILRRRMEDLMMMTESPEFDGEWTFQPTDAGTGSGTEEGTEEDTLEGMDETGGNGFDVAPVAAPVDAPATDPSDNVTSVFESETSTETNEPFLGNEETIVPTGEGQGEVETNPPQEQETPSPTPLTPNMAPTEPFPAPTDAFPAPTDPFPAPTDSFPAWSTPSPTPRPESTYVATDDDPLQPLNPEVGEDTAWQWTDSTVEEVEHDRTVLMALTITFTVGICLAIMTAQQMLENPHGCCAR